jgi:hypothetical protein
MDERLFGKPLFLSFQQNAQHADRDLNFTVQFCRNKSSCRMATEFVSNEKQSECRGHMALSALCYTCIVSAGRRS